MSWKERYGFRGRVLAGALSHAGSYRLAFGVAPDHRMLGSSSELTAQMSCREGSEVATGVVYMLIPFKFLGQPIYRRGHPLVLAAQKMLTTNVKDTRNAYITLHLKLPSPLQLKITIINKVPQTPNGNPTPMRFTIWAGIHKDPESGNAPTANNAKA